MSFPRNWRVALWAVWLAAAALLLLRFAEAPAPAHAAQSSPPQPSPQSQEPGPRIRTTVSLVVVPVTVKGSAGELVTDLQQSEFRVFEDGIEQEISQFSVEPFPLSAAVLVDNDLKRSTAETVQESLQAVGGGFSARDEVSLWRFDQFPAMVADFLADNDALLTQLKRVELNSSVPGVGSAAMTQGPRVNTQPMPGAPPRATLSLGVPTNKSIHDAIFAAGEQLRERPVERRKLIFLISDGQNGKNNTHSYEETLKLLQSADISVYAIGVGEAGLNRGINILARYAHATGGDIFYGSDREILGQLYARVAEQARYQYTIAYAPSKTNRNLPYHTIEVRVRRPGLSLLAREGYYPGGKL